MTRGTVYEGKVLWFNYEKGWGFIERPNDSDLFVHFRDIMNVGTFCFKRLYSGQDVRYRIGRGPRGEYAINVFPSRPWFHYDQAKKKYKN